MASCGMRSPETVVDAPATVSSGRVLQPRTGIHLLPPELLVAIFAYTLNPFPHGRAKQVMDLGSVSALWRAVTSAPQLWDAVAVQGCDPRTFDLGRIESLLSRSKAAPLDLLVDSPEGEEEYSDEDTWGLRFDPVAEANFQAAASVLRPHLDRTRSLDLIVNSNTAASCMLPLAGPLGMLRELRLDLCSDFPSELVASQGLLGVDSAPSLSTLGLRAGCLPPSFLDTLPSNSLRDLRVSVTSTLGTHLTSFLARAPTLERVTIVDVIDVETVDKLPHNPTAIDSPALRVLEIPAPYLIPHLATWYAPNLEHLLVHPFITDAHPLPRRISLPKLRTLTIVSRHRHEPSPMFADILHSLPALVATDLPCYEQFATAFLTLLASPTSPASSSNSIPTPPVHVCPKLKFLRFRAFHSSFPLIVPAIRQFLRSRIASAAKGEVAAVQVQLYVLSEQNATAKELAAEFDGVVTIERRPVPLERLFQSEEEGKD